MIHKFLPQFLPAPVRLIQFYEFANTLEPYEIVPTRRTNAVPIDIAS